MSKKNQSFEGESYIKSFVGDAYTVNPPSSRRNTGNESRAISRSKAVSLGPTADQIICTIAEGRGVATVIVDSQTYIRTLQKLDVFDPTEIIFPITSSVPNKSKLFLLVEEFFPGSKFIQASRRSFSEEADRNLILQYAFASEKEALAYELSDDKYYMISAASAMLQYIKSKYSSFFDFNKLRIKIQSSEDSMIISTRTLKSLEVINNSIDKSNGPSLFKVMNFTKTSMGARVLRSNLVQPLTNLSSILRRHEALEELCNDMPSVKECQAQLTHFEDLDKLLTSMSVILKKKNESNSSTGKSDHRVNQVIMLKEAISASLMIADILKGFKSPMLIELKDLLEGEVVREVQEMIMDYINPEIRWARNSQELRNQRNNAVKAGANGFLDAARDVFNEYTRDTFETCKSYGQTYGINPSCVYDSKRGYFLRIAITEKEELDKLPENIFVNRKRNKKYLECTTLDLMKCNTRLKSITSEITMISDQILDELFDKLNEAIFPLFMVSEAVSVLDLLCSFATLVTSSTAGYVKPVFTTDHTEETGVIGGNQILNSGKLALKQSRHPVLDRIMKYKPFIPNDIYAAQDTSRMNIITGVNMSGKSVYLRQIALLAIMAQTGCFIPAEFARMPIYRALYARISNDPDDDMLKSSFTAEMTEIAYILHHVKEPCSKDCNVGIWSELIIIDELGRGSSVADGLAVSLAIADWLVRQSFTDEEMPRAEGTIYRLSNDALKRRKIAGGTRKAVTTFMSTHFHDLAKAMGMRPGVSIINMRADIQQMGMTMHYKATKTSSDNMDDLLYGNDKQQQVSPDKDSNNNSSNRLYYGLMLAKSLPFPQKFIDLAYENRNILQENENRQTLLNEKGSITEAAATTIDETSTTTSTTTKLVGPAQLWRQKKKITDLYEALVHIDEIYYENDTESDDQVKKWLLFLQNQFINVMDDINNGKS